MSGHRGRVELDLWSYNLDNGRRRRTVHREVSAILDTGPAALVGVEAIGYHFRIPGYRLHVDGMPRRAARRAGRNWRSRANVAIWVREDLAFRDIDPDRQWTDLNTTWPRPKYPWRGPHEARSILLAPVGRIDLYGVHQPPPNLGRLTEPAQREGIEALARRMKPWLRPDGSIRHRPRVALGDWNRRPGQDGPGPGELAERLGGRTTGHRIDGAVTVGDLAVTEYAYPSVVGGVRLRSDHRHAFRLTITVDRRWTRPFEEHR